MLTYQNSCNVAVIKMTSWNWLNVNLIFSNNALLAHSPLAMGPLLLCILNHKISRCWIFEYCVVGVLCRSLFVSDRFRLSPPISPASECKASVEAVDQYECGPWMKHQPPVRLSLNLNPPASFAEALLSVFVPFSFPLGFSGQIPLNCLNVSSGMA